MNMSDIHTALNAINEMSLDNTNARAQGLVAIIADMVNSETSDGEGTQLNVALESQDWWETLNALMRDALFRKLGNGHFSAAYSHPMLPGKVIKVGFKKEDSGAAYIAFCRMNQGRAGIPTIYDVQRHTGCYTVVMDALNECDIYDNDSHAHYKTIAQEVIECNSSDYDYCGDEFDAEFVQVCKDIRKFFNGIAHFDMHSGNIMFDDFDRPFITDPVSFNAVDKTKTFSIDPEELLQEIEKLSEEGRIAKAIQRHARKADRLENARGRRKMRKMAKQWRKNRTKRIAADNRRFRQQFRNENHAKLLMGTANWQNVWLRMGNFDMINFEGAKAAQKVNHDHIAIQAGGDLWIDKKFDAMFMG